MKKLIAIALILTLLLSMYWYHHKQQQKTELIENTALIQESVQNVGKLVVTEAHFSEVFNYKNSKDLFGSYITSEKKALVVVNAEVSVSYDLSKMRYEIDEENKTLGIVFVPEPEIKINPEFEYYDVQDDFLNPFEAKDYNEIKESVKQKLKTKIEASKLKEDAKERLFNELTKFYILTNSLGWTLQYNDNTVTDLDLLKDFAL